MKDRQGSIQKVRVETAIRRLYKKQVSPDPIEQFTRWFEEALQAGIADANAMVLATSPPDGFPTARMVFLKDYGQDGFIFFSNFRSRKSRHLMSNPKASLLFYWSELERQVRIEGTVGRLSREAAEAYFRSRPRENQLAAWLPDQSEVAQDRQSVEGEIEEVRRRFEGRDVQMPDFWGGFLVKPQRMEFWQGRHSRLHDRLRYSLVDDQWRIERLFP
jgi:pyridoxamine 5'-phosphate oxidase